MNTAMLVGVNGDQALFDADGRGVLLNVRTHSTRVCDLENEAAARSWFAATLTASVSAWSEIATYACGPRPRNDVEVLAASGNEARLHTVPRVVKQEAALGLARARRLGGQTAMSLYTGQLLAAGGQLPYQKLQHVARFLRDHPLASLTSRNPYEKTTWSLWGGDAARRWVTSMQRKETLTLVSDGFLVEPADLEPFDDDSETILFALTQPGDPFAVEALIKLGIDEEQGISTTEVWDAGHWSPFTDEAQLDEWAPRLVEVDGETAMNVAAALDERPGELVHLSVLNPHEMALALMESFTAAVPTDDPSRKYTPEERAANASQQPRDANGRFATVGAQGAMKSGERGQIRGINPANNYLLIEGEDGKVYSIPSRDFEIQDVQLPGRPPVQDPGEPPAGQPSSQATAPRLDLSKILAQPRALPNSTKAVLDRSLPPMNPAALRSVVENYNQYILDERQKNARKFHTFAGLDDADALTPDTSDVKPIYLAVVDRDDPTAVLDLVALSPASAASNQATTFRRVSGQWIRDDKVLQDMKSPTPPPVVTLDEADYRSVLEQVDQSDPNESTQPEPVTAAVQYFIGANNQVWSFVAAGDSSGVGSAERLREYWTTGKGGLKIRWGTGGDWTRCHRHLMKYLGKRSAGYCANLHHRMNGFWPGDQRNLRR